MSFDHKACLVITGQGGILWFSKLILCLMSITGLFTGRLILFSIGEFALPKPAFTALEGP